MYSALEWPFKEPALHTHTYTYVAIQQASRDYYESDVTKAVLYEFVLDEYIEHINSLHTRMLCSIIG